jgi:HSP20 family protein
MTTLVRWDPLRDVSSLHTELSRLMNGLLEGPGGRQVQAWVPTLDVWESEDSVTYAFDLPGVSQDDITIEVEDGVLNVSATREQAKEIDSERFHRLERRYGTFSRSVGLPQGVTENAITASYKDGVLHIVVPKPEQQKPKRIAISVDGSKPTIEGTSSEG